MNILTYIGIAIGGLIAVGSTLGITLGIVLTIIYKIFRSVKYKINWQYNAKCPILNLTNWNINLIKSEKEYYMVGNITVGIVVLLIVGGIIFGCRIDHQATKEADEKNNSAVK